MTKNQAFWTDNNFEPKQNFKFRLLFEFTELDNQVILDIPYQYVVSVDKPRFYVKEKISKLLNEERKFPTNVTWSPINIIFIDTVDNKLMSSLSQFINLERKNTNSFRINNYALTDNVKTPTKSDIILENIRIQQLKNEDSFALDGGTQSIEEWVLHYPWISSFEPSQVSYSNEGLSTYSFLISYDWATVEYNGNIPKKEQVAQTSTSTIRQANPPPEPLEFDQNMVFGLDAAEPSLAPSTIPYPVQPRPSVASTLNQQVQFPQRTRTVRRILPGN
jgi:hypothetical protein